MNIEAKQEISKGNYAKALAIYEHLIHELEAKEHLIPNALLIGKANCLALSGLLPDSFQIYLKAFKSGEVQPQELYIFTDALVKAMNINAEPRQVQTQTLKRNFLQCSSCTGILLDPVTIPCGHTCCKVCTERKTADNPCGICKEPISRSAKWNIDVVLQDFLKKFVPHELEASRLRLKGNELYASRDMEGALKKYRQAYVLGQTDHLLQSNLSHVLCINGQFEQALEKAERACNLQPEWPKGYYRKGCALIGLGRNIDAAAAFAHCLARQPNNASVRNSLVKVLNELFSSAAATASEDDKCRVGSARTEAPGESSTESHELQEIIKLVQDSEVQKGLCSGELLFKKVKADSNVCGDDFECTLCCRLFYEPVTTPCGHTFCRACLNRNLDHRPCCPICRFLLDEYLAERKQNVTLAIDLIIKELFPAEFDERKEQHKQEMEQLASVADDTAEDIPVFVCALALPAIPCPLHIFEPRYRLMVRQCVESGSRQFGMCVPSRDTGFVDYGVMLEIRDVQYLPDGRSFVDTVGGRRFKVLNRGMRDGYHTAKVEWIRDRPVPLDELDNLNELHQAVYSEATQWFESLPLLIRRKVCNTCNGEMPSLENAPFQLPQGPAWLWWMVSVCPISTEVQISMLATKSLRDRLLCLREIIADQQLQYQ